MARHGRWSPAALLAMLLLPLAFLACKREDPKIRALTKQAAQADEAADLLRQAWREQFHRLTRVKVKNLVPGEDPMLLTDEQKRALEMRVHQEKDSSRRGLLKETLEKDGELQLLLRQLADLKSALPTPEIVRPNDSHYGLALRFLRNQGQSEDQARKVLSQVAISERLLPGFEVYHFYVDGAYGTWVSQGRTRISPREFARQVPEAPIDERDEALARGRRLQREMALLADEKQRVEAEISAIQAERAYLLTGRVKLQTDNAEQLARLNSLHYLVGVRHALEQEGIIEIPLLGKDRSGRNWRDAVFTRHLDLRTGRSLTIRAEELGLKQIGQVSVVPGSHLPGEHYRLTLSADRQSATVELLVLPRFRNDKVVFAVAE